MSDRRIRNEIEHGRYLASHNAGEIWNWETPAGKIRMERRVKMLTDSLQDGMKVLELGCGTGLFTRRIAEKQVQITAIDISDDLIEIARKNITNENVIFCTANAVCLPFPDCHFDAVIGSSVLHHLEILPALAEIYRVLNPGGFMSFTEPNMLNPQIALQKNIPALKRRLGDSPDETAFIAWKLRKKIKRYGFTRIQIEPFDFLHPGLPAWLIRFVMPLSSLAESIPLLKYISGSLFIQAYKNEL